MLAQFNSSEYALDIAEDWLADCCEDDGIEPEYFYIDQSMAQILFGKNNLSEQFYVTKYKTGMVKLLPKEEGLFAN
jgi:hypothetical protein